MPSEIYRLSREVDFRERYDPRYPLPPANVHVTVPDKGVIDIRWDSPCLIIGNGKYEVVGVNIYRSYDSQFNNYEKVNIAPVGSNFYRDSNQNRVVIDEDVSNNFLARGCDHPEGIWVVRPEHWPIVKAGSQGVPANGPDDVVLKIDGTEVRVNYVLGETGEVFLNTARIWDEETRTLQEPLLPTPTSTVLLSYRYNSVLITNQLAQRIFYKVTTLAIQDGEYVETPLEEVTAHNSFEIEKLSYIWKEAIRRNRWILEQGGEAVKVFIRKWVGPRCSCYSRHHKQAENDCPVCFGTGIAGGYEGPFDILVAPQDGERNIQLTENGMNVMHQYEVWTGPTPLLSQRDFIVRQNNDRYSIGPVNVPSSRGNVLQQHFMIGYLDEKAIQYEVPANPNLLTRLAFPETRIARSWEKPGVEGTVYPQITDIVNTGQEKVADGYQDRGRTPTYGRIVR